MAPGGGFMKLYYLQSRIGLKILYLQISATLINAPSLNKNSLKQSQQIYSRKINNVTRIHRCGRCNVGFGGTIHNSRSDPDTSVRIYWNPRTDKLRCLRAHSLRVRWGKRIETHKWNFWECCKIKQLRLLIGVGCDHYLHTYFSFNSLRVLAVNMPKAIITL